MDLKLDHHTRDGIEVVDVEGEIDVYTAPRLRELLIELVNNGHYQLVVNMEKVEFLDSTGLGVLVGGSSGSAPTMGRSTWCAPRSASSRSSASPG